MRNHDSDLIRDSEWRRPVLVNGWIDYGSSDLCLYRIRGEYLEIIGAIKNGTLGAGTPVMNLPGVRLRQRIGAVVGVQTTVAPEHPGQLTCYPDGSCLQNWAWEGNTAVWLNVRVPIL